MSIAYYDVKFVLRVKKEGTVECLNSRKIHDELMRRIESTEFLVVDADVKGPLVDTPKWLKKMDVTEA